MSERLSGGLIRVLKSSRVAWYRKDGISAYYEQPSTGVPGVLAINGQHVAKLVIDQAGLYADVPAPNVQRMMTERGISLECGWGCAIETHGMGLDEAIAESAAAKGARHHDGHISVWYDDPECAMIFVDGAPRWRIQRKQVSRVLAELGLSLLDGWYPAQQKLLATSMHPAPDMAKLVPWLPTRPLVPEMQYPLVPPGAYGKSLLVPIEDPGNILPDLTVEQLIALVPHTPLHGYQCRANPMDGRRIGSAQIINPRTFRGEIQSASLVLWFGTAAHEPLPPGIPARLVAQFVQIGFFRGLKGCAMKFGVSLDGCAEGSIQLLRPDEWRPQ
jgi:hypothetical protein